MKKMIIVVIVASLFISGCVIKRWGSAGQARKNSFRGQVINSTKWKLKIIIKGNLSATFLLESGGSREFDLPPGDYYFVARDEFGEYDSCTLFINWYKKDVFIAKEIIGSTEDEILDWKVEFNPRRSEDYWRERLKRKK